MIIDPPGISEFDILEYCQTERCGVRKFACGEGARGKDGPLHGPVGWMRVKILVSFIGRGQFCRKYARSAGATGGQLSVSMRRVESNTSFNAILEDCMH